MFSPITTPCILTGKRRKAAFAFLLLGMCPGLFCLGGCQPHEGSESQLKEDVDSFATYYYNWHFEKAAKYCTPESETWLRYASSNVHQADIDLLHGKHEDAIVEIHDIDFGDDEVSATANLEVTDFYQMDSIGKPAHLVRKARFKLPMAIHEGKWKVVLRQLPQKEK